MFMTLAGFIILLFLVLLVIWIFVELAQFPGQKARERNHPQAEAINILGWIGPLLEGVGWVVALVWAYTKPVVVVIQADASPQVIGDAIKQATDSANETKEADRAAEDE